MSLTALHPESAEFLLNFRILGISGVNIQGDCTINQVATWKRT